MILKIKDNDYKLHWGMGCLEMFCDTLDCEIGDLDKAFSPGRDQIKYLTTLILAAVKNGAGVASVYDNFEVSHRDLQAYLDELNQEEIKAIVEDFKASRYMGKTIAEHLFGEVEEDIKTTAGVKKKSRSAKS